MSDCLFCAIAAGDVPAAIVHQDEQVVAFRDINPQAPTHILVVPREHIGSAAEVTSQQDGVWARLLHVAVQLADGAGVSGSGFRLVTNVGADAGQSVGHLHLHLLGGRPMSWPPG